MKRRAPLITTAGAGFIGSLVVDTFIEAGHQVVIVDGRDPALRQILAAQ